MPVAKSYQNLEIVRESYVVNGKNYVDVKMNNGTVKTARWYSDVEYKKYYGDLPSGITFKDQKRVLGFIDGYITIFKGDTYAAKDWFKEHGATYKKWWGWSFASDKEVPANLPDGVEAVRLDWDLVGVDDKLKSDDTVKAAIETLMYEPSDSEYVGEIGERLELFVTVKKVLSLDGFYGPSTLYVFYDENGNCFSWITSSIKTKMQEGKDYLIRGTVKKFETRKNVPTTVLTRCVLVNNK